MQSLHDAAQFILQILRDPAWGGVGSICALLGILLAILLSRQSKISHPQEPHPAKINRSRRNAPKDEARYFLRDGYHRAILTQELVKDIDVIDSTNLNRYLSQTN
jgi:hypothetical protein